MIVFKFKIAEKYEKLIYKKQSSQVLTCLSLIVNINLKKYNLKALNLHFIFTFSMSDSES